MKDEPLSRMYTKGFSHEHGIIRSISRVKSKLFGIRRGYHKIKFMANRPFTDGGRCIGGVVYYKPKISIQNTNESSRYISLSGVTRRLHSETDDPDCYAYDGFDYEEE